MYAFRVVHEGLYHKPGRRARLDAGRHLGVSRRPRGGAARRVFRVRRRRRTLPQLVIATRSDERACFIVGLLTLFLIFRPNFIDVLFAESKI